MATLYLSNIKQKTATGFDTLILKSTGVYTGKDGEGNPILLDAALTNMTTAINAATTTANAALPKAGGTMTGTLTLAADPTNDLEATTKKYVDDAKSAVAGDVTALTGRVATIEGDYLKAADKTALEGKITAEETARKQADEAQVERIEALEGTIVGLSGAMHFKGVKDSVPADGTGYEQGDVIIVGNKEYVLNGNEFVEFGDASVNAEAITALTGRVDTAEDKIEAIEADYLKAADKTELEGKITAEGVARGQADDALSTRLDTIEGNIGTGTVDSRIATAKQEAIDAAASAADTKDEAILAAAKKYADDEDAKIESTVNTLSQNVDTKAAKADLEALTGRVATIEGDYLKAADKTALEGQISTVSGKADQNASDIAAIEADYLKAADKTALEGKITAEETARKQADEAQVERIAAIEGDYLKAADKTALEGQISTVSSKADQNASDIDTLEGKVATLEATVAKPQHVVSDTQPADTELAVGGIWFEVE